MSVHSISTNFNYDDKVSYSKTSEVCVIIGHDIEAMTSAVVLASLGHRVHLYADKKALEQQRQQYGFEHHLQALWQLYRQQRQIITYTLPHSADSLIHNEESLKDEERSDDQRVAFYWLFLDSIKTVWADSDWINGFNHSQQQSCPIIMSGIEPLGHIAQLAQRLRRTWVYYVPFVFLQDGEAYSSMLTPSLWLLGEKTPNSIQHLPALQPLIAHARAAHCNDIATIEFARSTIMAMLATRVSFMNEMSRLADAQQVDIQVVSQIMGLDERVGGSYLKAGWGFGGNTLPTELSKLQESSAKNSVAMPLLQSVMHINDDQKELIFRKFWQYFDGFIDHKTVLIWGGSYKADSGRTAGSAIHPLLDLLWSYNIRTLVYSGKACAELAERYGSQDLLQLIDSPYKSIKQAQALFIISISAYQPVDMAQLNQQAIPIFDAQNALNRSQINALVGDYVGIGRAK